MIDASEMLSAESTIHEFFGPKEPVLAVVSGEEVAKRKFFIVCLDGSEMLDEQGVFESFYDGFRFPSYFGHNWDALEECIRDLSWIDAERYMLCILNAERVLERDDVDNLSTFREILLAAGEWWKEPYEPLQPWGHPASDFRVILQFSTVDVSLSKMKDSGSR